MLINKKIPLLIFISLILVGVNEAKKTDYNPTFEKVSKLFDEKNFFKAERLFNENKADFNKYQQVSISAKVNNAFNKLEASEHDINKLINNYSQELNHQQKSQLIELSLENNIKLFNYSKAYEAAFQLLHEYKQYLNKQTVKKLSNEIQIWKALIDAPKQQILKKEATVINLIEGFKVPISFNNHNESITMLFDTGANFSLVVESLVEPLGMKMLDAKFTVKSIIGEDIQAGLAITPKLSFGDVELSHVIFMVFPDEVLTFKDSNFKINGIIGYPVIAALKEIQFQKGNRLYIPKKSSTLPFKNLALDFLTPIVEIHVENEPFIFSFDTGADTTWLYQKYYESHQHDIEANYQKTKIKIGGIGGSEEYDAYNVNLKMKLGNSLIQLDSINTTVENVAESHDYYYGNIGQDAIKTHDNLTINFEHMYINMTNN